MVLALDRAGIVGADGATHAGLYDIAFLRCIPNVSIACPADEAECRQLLSTAYAQDHTVAVRYPRGSGVGAEIPSSLDGLPFGKAEWRLRGRGVAILAFGTLLYPALQAGESLGASVVNMRWAKPIDLDALREAASSHAALVTVEEGCVTGGAGAAVAQALADMGINLPVLHLGIPDAFTEHGDPAALLAELGLDASGIESAVRARLAAHVQTPLPLKLVQ
jgi:1-deoxy-D-xylulose-5-phosphate synthase